MRRLGPVLTLLIAIPALVALAGCSSGSDKATDSPTTTASTTAVPTSTTVTTAPAATTTTGGGSEGGPTTTVKAGTVFTNFTVTPASPVTCNAPTMVELRWTAVGVSSVDLSVDGTHKATFQGGSQDTLQYFACDGKKHTYTLSAKKGSTTETSSQVVDSKVVS